MNLLKIVENFEHDHPVEHVDLADNDQLNLIEELSDKLFVQSRSSSDLTALENDLVNTQGKFGFLSHTAVKVAKSKKLLSELNCHVHFTIILSLFKTQKHIHGSNNEFVADDALVKKVKQVQYLVSGIRDITWEMICIDNGCPENSGYTAQEIINKNNFGENVKVLFDNSIDLNSNEAFSNTHIRKLASLEYGIIHALNSDKENHVIIYADTSLMIHAGQCGLLINSVIKSGYLAAVGSGREPDSIIVKSFKRNVPEKLFIYLRKRLLKRLNYVTDLRYAFQAYSAEFLSKVLKSPTENIEAFDFELLLKADLVRRKSIQNVAISRIRKESDAGKSDDYPYLIQLKSYVKMYHKFLTPNAISHKYAFFIKSLAQQDWEILSNNVPEGIQIKPAVHFDIYDEYAVEDFKTILEKNLKQTNS